MHEWNNFLLNLFLTNSAHSVLNSFQTCRNSCTHVLDFTERCPAPSSEDVPDYHVLGITLLASDDFIPWATGETVSRGFEPAKVLVRGLPLPRPLHLPSQCRVLPALLPYKGSRVSIYWLWRTVLAAFVWILLQTHSLWRSVAGTGSSPKTAVLVDNIDN